MLVLLLALGALQDDPVEKKVKALVEKLDADEPAARNQAQEELAALGESVVPLLEKAKAGAGVEAPGRIDTILGELTLPAKWAKDFQADQTRQGAHSRSERGLRAEAVHGNPRG